MNKLTSTNPKIEKLRKLEQRAQRIALSQSRCQADWDKAYAAARHTPEWTAYCNETGSVTSYNYGDVIC